MGSLSDQTTAQPGQGGWHYVWKAEGTNNCEPFLLPIVLPY